MVDAFSPEQLIIIKKTDPFKTRVSGEKEAKNDCDSPVKSQQNIKLISVVVVNPGEKSVALLRDDKLKLIIVREEQDIAPSLKVYKIVPRAVIIKNNETNLCEIITMENL